MHARAVRKERGRHGAVVAQERVAAGCVSADGAGRQEGPGRCMCSPFRLSLAAHLVRRVHTSLAKAAAGERGKNGAAEDKTRQDVF